MIKGNYQWMISLLKKINNQIVSVKNILNNETIHTGKLYDNRQFINTSKYYLF